LDAGTEPPLSQHFEGLTSVPSDRFSQQTGQSHYKTFCRTYTSPFRHIYPTNWAYRTYISPFTNIYPTKWAWITLSDNIDEIIISKGIESKPGFLFIAKWFEKMIICGRDSRSDKNEKWMEFGRPSGLDINAKWFENLIKDSTSDKWIENFAESTSNKNDKWIENFADSRSDKNDKWIENLTRHSRSDENVKLFENRL